VRHLLVGDGRCLHRTAGDDGGRQGTAENIEKQRKKAEDGGGPQGTAGDDGGRWETVGDGGGRHNVGRPGPGLLLVGQVQKMTGRDDTMSSVLVLPQDGRTAPLRTLVESLAVLIVSVLPAASYIYTKLSSKKHTSSPSLNSVLPSPSLAFQTTLS